MSHWIIGIQFDGFAKILQGKVVLSLQSVDVTPVTVSFGVLGIQFDRFGVVENRQIVTLLVEIRDRQVVNHARIVGAVLDVRLPERNHAVIIPVAIECSEDR